RILVKLPALAGVNWTTTFVEPKPARAKAEPEATVNGPPEMLAVPPLKSAPPMLVTRNVAWELVPTATGPKSKLDGETASWAGVSPAPVTRLVLLPPLLMKTTLLLKLPALVGLKLT